jgi:hypothetical protein
MTAEWVSAIAEVITAAGVFIAILQLRETRKSEEEDHERSRREGAVQYALVWTNSLTPQSSKAARLADRLTLDECRAIANLEKVTIPIRHMQLVEASFPEGTKFSTDGGHVQLSIQQTTELRWILVKYLNSLEIICAAWHAATVDRNIMEDEFKYLIDSRDGRQLLKFYREAEGEEFFPAIAAFEKALKERHQPKAPQQNVDQH